MRHKDKIILFTFLFILIFDMIIVGHRAFAHKVSVFAYSEGGMVYTENYFSDGTPVKNGEIQVYDSSGNLVFKGKTDSKGICNFKVPKVDDLKIVLNASMGHRAEFILKKEDIPISDNNVKEGVNATKKEDLKNSQKGSIEGINESGGLEVVNEQGSLDGEGLTADEIRKIVSEEVSKQLKPIARGIAKLEEKRPGPTEIIGGIGYIMGLVGIAMFFKAKKRS